MTLTDTLNRPLRDLRISVTDRCNFRCTYCMPESGLPGKLPHHKEPFAHDAPYLATLPEALEAVRPTTLIGASGVPRTFTQTPGRSFSIIQGALNQVQCSRPVLSPKAAWMRLASSRICRLSCSRSAGLPSICRSTVPAAGKPG